MGLIECSQWRNSEHERERFIDFRRVYEPIYRAYTLRLDEWMDEMDLHETREHFSEAHKTERISKLSKERGRERERWKEFELSKRRK